MNHARSGLPPPHVRIPQPEPLPQRPSRPPARPAQKPAAAAATAAAVVTAARGHLALKLFQPVDLGGASRGGVTPPGRSHSAGAESLRRGGVTPRGRSHQMHENWSKPKRVHTEAQIEKTEGTRLCPCAYGQGPAFENVHRPSRIFQNFLPHRIFKEGWTAV